MHFSKTLRTVAVVALGTVALQGQGQAPAPAAPAQARPPQPPRQPQPASAIRTRTQVALAAGQGVLHRPVPPPVHPGQRQLRQRHHHRPVSAQQRTTEVSSAAHGTCTDQVVASYAGVANVTVISRIKAEV